MPPEAVLRRYGLAGAAATVAGTGLINRTWLVTRKDGRRYILQLVNPMFTMEVHEDIAAVTVHLQARGLVAPRLIPAEDGEPAVLYEGSVWRLYNYLEGVTFDSAFEPAIAGEAGRLLAGFHGALLDLEHRFRNRRSGVHDTGAHLGRLETALSSRRAHARYPDVSPLACEILDQAAALPSLPDLAPRKVHGDPKLNNCLFELHSRKGICMIDFDTLGVMPLPLELGDAMRSWCNPAGENSVDTTFSLENFRAALEAYADAARGFIIDAEWRAILPATRTIYLELAARFCADALNEDVFAWDPHNFDSHSEHSRVRAAGQLNALKSLERQLPEAEGILEEIFG